MDDIENRLASVMRKTQVPSREEKGEGLEQLMKRIIQVVGEAEAEIEANGSGSPRARQLTTRAHGLWLALKVQSVSERLGAREVMGE